MARKLKKKQKGGPKDKDVYKKVDTNVDEDLGPVNESRLQRGLRKLGSKIAGTDDWTIQRAKDKRYFTDKANKLAKKKPTKRRTKRILKLREKAKNVKTYAGEELTEFKKGGMKKMMYKSGGFLEPKTPNLDDL
tara:strand:+ start:864 stop:1265 length:402 start_codon:yes stop_codon:yes gene_type:complete